MTEPRKRVTQQDIARMTGVSQATVSLVLNNRDDAEVRIAPETRQRVLQAIREIGYVADPVARRLVGRRNRILGVFTYEPVFPSSSLDFYHPFLLGIEECAEGLGCDLLLFTSAPVTGGRRRIFHEDNRLRLADGCVLLGRDMDRAALARLLREGYAFVTVGRRDDAGGPVPYVGADYPSATAELVRRAVALGHRRLAYVGLGEGSEPTADRLRGFTTAVTEAGASGAHARRADGATLDGLLASGVTAVLVEELTDGVALVDLARQRSLSVPTDLSIVALGDPTRPMTIEMSFTMFSIPRKEMGRQAVELLIDLLAGEARQSQRLLPCEIVDGATLARAPRRARR